MAILGLVLYPYRNKIRSDRAKKNCKGPQGDFGFRARVQLRPLGKEPRAKSGWPGTIC